MSEYFGLFWLEKASPLFTLYPSLPLRAQKILCLSTYFHLRTLLRYLIINKLKWSMNWTNCLYPSYHIHYINCIHCYYPDSYRDRYWLYCKQIIEFVIPLNLDTFAHRKRTYNMSWDETYYLPRSIKLTNSLGKQQLDLSTRAPQLVHLETAANYFSQFVLFFSCPMFLLRLGEHWGSRGNKIHCFLCRASH